MSTYILKNALVIPCTGKETYFKGDILIEGDKIINVNKDCSCFKAERVIDLEGCSLLPGFVDLHIHSTFRRAIGPVKDIIKEHDVFHVIRSVRNLLTLLRQGVTTIREVSAKNDINIMIRDAINRQLMPGPRMLVAGSPLTVTGGHGMETCIRGDGTTELRKFTRHLISKGVDWIKVMGSVDPINSPVDGEYTHAGMTIPEVRSILITAKQFQKKVAIHAMGSKYLKQLSNIGVDTIEHGIYLDEEGAEIMIKKNVALVPTLSGYIETSMGRWNRGKEWQERHKVFVQPHRDSFQIALNKGVFIGFGTDSSGELLQEMQLMMEYGMPLDKVLLSATLNSAKILGLDRQIGSIEPGKIADLVIVKENVLEDIKNIRKIVYVIKNGNVLKPKEIILPSGDEGGDSESWLER